MVRDRLTYRVYEDKGSSKNYDRDVYCLDYTKSFPGAAITSEKLGNTIVIKHTNAKILFNILFTSTIILLKHPYLYNINSVCPYGNLWGSSKNYDRDVYCLDYTKSFPGAEGNNTNFTSTGDLDSSIKNKERIRLIAENMYMASMTQEEKDAFFLLPQ